MNRRRSPQRGPQIISSVFAALTLLSACKSGEAAATGAGGGPGEGEAAQPPTSARVDRLVEKTIIDFDEYLASLTSRRSINLYPQIAGYVRSIHFNPGDTVKAGALLVEIDPGQQRALLRSLDANLQTRKAALAYAVQNDESSRGLVTAGVLGELDFQQRHSQRATAEADVKAAEAQIEAQSALLRFYAITAPIDGIVGDFPVKVGDYVDPQTRLTSVDQNKSVEAYVYVPMTKANAIRKDTTIQLVDDSGTVVCEEKPSFISPQVSVDTQTVLVKATCPNKGTLRAAQVLKARVVWSRRPGVTIPISAVTRESGQYFAYVVERNPEGLVAKQRAIEVGPIQDNDFVVMKGLEAGTEIVATNIQKVHDGSHLAPPPIAAPGDKPVAADAGR